MRRGSGALLGLGLPLMVLVWTGCGDKSEDSGTAGTGGATTPTATTPTETGGDDGGGTSGGDEGGGTTGGGTTGGSTTTSTSTTISTTGGTTTTGGDEPCFGQEIGTALEDCAQDFSLLDRDGKAHSLWAHHGEVIYLDLSGFT